MKTKLTLTVKKEIVEKAKMQAASRGISLSKMFEEIFEKESPDLEKTESQLAAGRLLKRLESIEPMKGQKESDKALVTRFLKQKYG